VKCEVTVIYSRYRWCRGRSRRRRFRFPVRVHPVSADSDHVTTCLNCHVSSPKQSSFCLHISSFPSVISGSTMSLPPRRQRQEAGDTGSRTMTISRPATPDIGNDASASAGPSNSVPEPPPVGVLKLRGGPGRRQRVVWRQGTVDNEGMGKKKSKSKYLSSVCRRGQC
jgi:hypothetical protein